MQPHGEQHNGSSKRINLAHWPWWYLLANGRQWRTPWVDPMFGVWQPPTHSVIQQQVQPLSTILRQLYATLIQQPMIQPSLCQILCYDTLDTAISKLWLSLPPIPYVLQLIQKSYMLQQASKSPFSYCHNNKLQGYNNLKLLYSNWYKLFWYYTPLDTTIYTLPSSYNTASSYVPILL